MNNLFNGDTNQPRFSRSLSVVMDEDDARQAAFDQWLKDDFVVWDLDGEILQNCVIAVLEGDTNRMQSIIEKVLNEEFEKFSANQREANALDYAEELAQQRRAF